MTYGTLTVICGPMGASKTTEILKRVLWAKAGQGKDVRVFKPALDARYSTVDLVSHDGLRTPAMSVTELPDALDANLIALDEVQFFDTSCVAWIKRHLEAGVDVLVAGLDLDWQCNPFPVTASLIAMADEVVKKTGNCSICGKASSKTYKKDQSGGSVDVGDFSKYETRCNVHLFHDE